MSNNSVHRPNSLSLLNNEKILDIAIARGMIAQTCESRFMISDAFQRILVENTRSNSGQDAIDILVNSVEKFTESFPLSFAERAKLAILMVQVVEEQFLQHSFQKDNQ